jgi:streptogramin lyase
MKSTRGRWAVLVVALLAAVGSAHAQCLTQFKATAFSGPEGIATGPDGNLWFTEFDAGSIGRILPAAPNTVTEFNVSLADIRPAGIASGPDGNLWFVEILGNNVGRITPTSPNTITRFPIPTATRSPQDIVAGPDGNLWFSEGRGGVGRILPGSPNTITEFPTPSGQGVGGITVGPDGNVWFAETFVAGNDGGNTVGRILPGSPNTITEFTIPTANGSPGGITTGPDGNLWFTEVTGNSIGRITPGSPNTITEFPIPTANSRPFAIVTGPDGNLWFTETGIPGQIGRITPGSPNTITEFTISGGHITNGPDGNLWFTQGFESIWRLAIAGCDHCVAGKLKAISKKQSAKLTCYAKVAATGDSSGLSACLAQAESKFSQSFTSAGECGSSEAACENRADLCVSQVVADLPDVGSACEGAKLRAAARAQASQYACAVRSALRGRPADPNCFTKMQTKLMRAFARADRLGPCTGDGNLMSFVVELACVIQVPVSDSTGRVMGLACY